MTAPERVRRATRATTGATLGVALLALSACSSGSLGGGPGGFTGASSGPGPDIATQQACRQRVNEMYEVRDRGDIYAANPSSNTPSSANSYVGVPSRGLSSQFAYEKSVAECEHNSLNGADIDNPPPAPPPAAKHP
jgi:hypothetical protein